MNKNTQQEDEEGEGKGGKGFFACYLLSSLSPRHKGHTYIGFTVNPKRRIRQHNGEIGSGAVRTKKKRPWELVMCIYGFPTNVSALQFEWAWQHPRESLAVSKAAATFKSHLGLGNKIKLALTMLTLPKWQNLDLTVNFFSSKYTKHLAGSQVPEWRIIRFCSMEDLPCYTGIYNHRDEDNDLADDTGINDAYTNKGVENIRVERDLYNYNSIDESGLHIKLTRTNTTLDISQKAKKGIGNSRIDDDLFNGFFDFGVCNDDPESDLTRAEDLCNSNVVEILDNEANEEIVATKGDSPIVCDEVEVINLLSPSPGYTIELI